MCLFRHVHTKPMIRCLFQFTEESARYAVVDKQQIVAELLLARFLGATLHPALTFVHLLHEQLGTIQGRTLLAQHCRRIFQLLLIFGLVAELQVTVLTHLASLSAAITLEKVL